MYILIKGLLINVLTRTIFFKSFDYKLELSKDLIGGFLSAIDVFAKGVGQDQIKEIVMDRIAFYYYVVNSKYDLNIILITDSHTKGVILEQIIGEIKREVLGMYSIQEIQDHICEPTYFNKLDGAITKIIQSITEESKQKISDKFVEVPLGVKPKIDLSKTSIPLLLEFKKKELGKLLFAMFIGIRVIVTGNNSLVKLIIDTLELFSPHRTLKKNYWTENPEIQRFDILGVPKKLAPLYLGSVIVNLDNRTVEGIKNNKYFDEMTNSIEKLKPEKILPFMDKKIYFLIEKAKEFAVLANKPGLSNKDLEKMSKNINKDILRIIETYYYWNVPESSSKIKSTAEKIRTFLLAKNMLL